MSKVDTRSWYAGCMRKAVPPQIHAAAARGAFVYCYLRSGNSSSGKKGSPYYIGISTKARRPVRWQYRNTAVPVDRDNIRIMRSGLTWEQACWWESYYIARYGRKDNGTGILHNKTDGGDGVPGRSEECRSKQGELMRERWKNPAYVESMRLKLRVAAVQSKAQRSEALREHFAKPGARERHRQQQSEAMGRPEVREKISLAHDRRFEQKLAVFGMTREEYDQTRRGKNAAAVRRYRARKMAEAGS